MAGNSSEWANAGLPSQVCQDLCSTQCSDSCSTEKTRLFHAAFQNPEDSSQAETQCYSPFSLVLGWLVEAQPTVIPTGDEHRGKAKKCFLSPAESRMLQKTLLLSGTYGSWTAWMWSKYSRVCWECLNLASSWDSIYHQGCVLPGHTSPQQSLGNEWHS